MKPQEVDRETSEFQDTNRMFQRIDEASVECWNALLAVQSPQGHIFMNEFINKSDVYFGIFRNICTPSEQKKVDEERVNLKNRINVEIKRINHASVYAPHINAQSSEKLREGLRSYLLEIGRLREVHKLASRTKRKIDWEKRAKNAVRY